MGPGVQDIMLNGIQGHKYNCYDQTRQDQMGMPCSK